MCQTLEGYHPDLGKVFEGSKGFQLAAALRHSPVHREASHDGSLTILVQSSLFVTNPYSILQALLLDEVGLCYTTLWYYREFFVQTQKYQ